MADAVTSQILVDGPIHVAMKFTNVSDGSGEDAVKKVDVSALSNSAGGLACTGVVIEKMWWQCIGITVIGLIPLIYWLCKNSDEEDNRFGSNPLK